MKSRKSDRGLTLADLAILVAGSAGAITMWRFSEATRRLQLGPAGTFGLDDKIAIWPGPALIGLAFSLLFARATRKFDRRRWWLFFRRPGYLAVVVDLAHLLMVVLFWSWREFWLQNRSSALASGIFHPNFNFYLYVHASAGQWVAVAWATLALSRSWRAEASWIDRAGRFLGICAIVQWLASSIVLS